MADSICSLNVENKKNVTRVIANSVLGPKKSGVIHFYNKDQVKHALRLEEDKDIIIKSEVPSKIIEEIETEKNEKTETKNPVQQVTEGFKGHHPADVKNSDGWNSPNDAYAGRDLKDRDYQSDDSSDDNEKTDSEEESTSPWNSPDDAYAGEDLKDREYEEETNEEDSEEESTEESTEEGNEDESDSSDETNEEGSDLSETDSPVGEQPESEEDNVETSEKPEWYLTYDQVEEKTRAQLLEWSASVDGLNLSKSKTAKEVTEAVHNFLAAQFPDHQK